MSEQLNSARNWKAGASEQIERKSDKPRIAAFEATVNVMVDIGEAPGFLPAPCKKAEEIVI